MIKNIPKILLTLLLIFINRPLVAKKYRASLAEMPVHAVSKEKGVQVELVKAIAKITNNEISINLYPFERSVNNIIFQRADFHIPLIKNDLIPEKKLPYYFSTETIFNVNFVLYTRKNSNVNLNNLSKHVIETDRAHIPYLSFKSFPSNSIESSLKKVNCGRIAGYIFADSAVDPILKKLAFKNIKRKLYKTFEVKIILPKSKHGKKIDKMLTKAIRKLRKSGKFQKIEGPVDKKYDNWQP